MLEQLQSLEGTAGAIILFGLYLLLGFLPAAGVTYVIYFLLTLPLRRNERVRFFLDLLERGLKEGHAPEQTIVQASATHDRALGVRFHLLAAYLEQGMRLSEALERVPRLLPAQLRATLKIGERIGDFSKVLAVGRRLVQDGVSQTRGAQNYLILLAFAVTPAMLLVPLVLRLKVLPSYQMVFAGMLQGPLPAFTRLIFAGTPLITVMQLVILGFIWLLAIFYLGGPRLHSWLSLAVPGGADWVLWRLPWRRKRLERDFSAVLAALLDAQVPEPEAVRLAGESTANDIVRDRADKICALLRQGVKLPEAIRLIDGGGELQWRLSNALRSGRGFLPALAGWHEALDAKAFQEEQTAAQLTTTGLVLLNGVLVASIVIAVFLALVQLLNEAILW